MYIELNLIKKDRSKQVKLFYMFCSILTIILKMIVLSLRSWYKYCWWDFGLITATSFKHYSNFKNENYIIDVQNDACKSLKSLVDQYCSGFCGNIDNLEKAGMGMIFLGSFSIAIHLLCVGFHLWSYFYPSFKFKRIWVWLLLPTILNFSGFLSFYLVVKPYKIEDFDGVKGPTYDRTNFTLENAFYTAIVTVVFDVCVMFFGFFKTRREFLPVVSDS